MVKSRKSRRIFFKVGGSYLFGRKSRKSRRSGSPGCKNRASRPSQGTVNGGAVSKWPRCRWDVKHNQPTWYWLLIKSALWSSRSYSVICYQILNILSSKQTISVNHIRSYCGYWFSRKTFWIHSLLTFVTFTLSLCWHNAKMHLSVVENYAPRSETMATSRMLYYTAPTEWVKDFHS